MSKFFRTFGNKIYFPFLLCLFFILHGFTRYFPSIGFFDSILLFFIYLIATIVIAFLCFLIIGSWKKALIITFFIIGFNFFFGSIHDFLAKVPHVKLFARYSFLLPLFLIVLIILFIYLRRTKKDLSIIISYLNLLFVILVAIDLISLTRKSISGKSIVSNNAPIELKNCSDCSWPDIYLIVADEYPGRQELKDLFLFDSSEFENQLKQREFHVTNQTRSNYNWTPYSLASTLNMEYLNLQKQTINYEDILMCCNAIQTNIVTKFFQQQGYTIYNYSVFDIENKPALLRHAFATPRKVLTAETFTQRFQQDLGFNFLAKNSLDKLRKEIKRKYLKNNINADSLTKNIVIRKSHDRKFVYTHFMLPHPPYFFDSSGKKNQEDALADVEYTNKQLFISYLLYTNQKLLNLIDTIQTNSKNPPIIILMSDHGFRQFETPPDKKYYFLNLNAVFLPNRNYSQFYDGMSNVNEFRILLNSQFGQKLPLLKDSSIYLWEK